MFEWWAQSDLNQRPSDYESPALTAELWAHGMKQWLLYGELILLFPGAKRQVNSEELRMVLIVAEIAPTRLILRPCRGVSLWNLDFNVVQLGRLLRGRAVADGHRVEAHV